jgi:aminopeptidase N
MNTLIEKQYTEVRVPNPARKEVDYLLFDPNRKVLKKIAFTQPYERMVSQVLKSKNMIDRYDALLAIRPEPVEKKSATLMQAFYAETFWLPRSEILRQLAPDHSPEAVELFREALNSSDANVRKTALLVLNPVPDLLRGTVEKLLYDSSYLNVEYALEALCVSFPESTGHYLDLTQDMVGWRGKNIRMMWLALAIKSGRTEYMPELIAYCGPKYEFETRMNAFNLLMNLKYSDAETLNYAETASKHWNNKLSGAAREYLKNSEVAR